MIFSTSAVSTLSIVETDDEATTLCSIVVPPSISTVLTVHDEPNRAI